MTGRPRRFPFPSVAGEGGAQRRMGCGKQQSASRRSAPPVLRCERSCLLPGDEMDVPPRFRQSSRKFARAQRQNMTRAETMLWRAVRNHRIDRLRLSPANADRALFRGFRLPCAQNRRRSGRSHARDGGGENQGRRKGRMVSTGGISRSSVSRRSHHRRASDRHRAHQGGDPGNLTRQDAEATPYTENSPPPLKARDDIGVTGPSFEQRTAPHPSLRATFPSRAGEGERPAPARR